MIFDDPPVRFTVMGRRISFKSLLNTVHHGDFREMVPILRSLQGTGLRVFAISDPPYNQRYHYDNYHDSLSDREYRELLQDAFTPFPSVVMHYPEQIINFLAPVMQVPVEDVVSWVYPSNTAKQHRLITWWGCAPDMRKVGQPYKNPNDKRVQKLIAQGKQARLYDWWEINQVKNVSKEGVNNHPCPIPYEVAEKMVLLTTVPGDVVFDPFCGSGTILLAAKNNDRYYVGADLSENYVELARRTLEG